jgi:hypothetical protein
MIEPKPEMWPAVNEVGATPVPPQERPGAAAAAAPASSKAAPAKLEKR